MDEILVTFLLTYRTTPNSTLPQQQSPAELFLGRKPRTSLDLLLPPKQPTGCDTKMERQFNRKHGAVMRGFEVKEQVYVQHHHSQDWKAASVSKQIGGRLYDVTLTDGSTRRFHVNEMRPRATHRTEDHFADFLTGFELPVPRTQAAREGTGPADEWTADENQKTSSQELNKRDNIEREQPSNVIVEPRRSKRGHIPKKQFELNPYKKKYQHP